MSYQDLTLEEARSALMALSSSIPREEWVELAMALKSEFGDEALPFFDEWSQAGDSYQPADVRATWRSISAGGGVTIATLIRRAKDAGWDFDRRELSDVDRARMKAEANKRRAKLAKKQAKEAADHKKKVAECVERSATIWEGLSEAGRSDYLAAKQVRAWGIRFARDRFAVPVRDAERRLVGLQWIDGQGDKKFLTGTQKRGSWHMIGEPSPRAPLAVAEGYATAASIHQATGWPVAVAFDAGNLVPVTQALFAICPTALFMICADDDFKTDGNPGVTCATEAAGLCRGRVVVPEFNSDDPDLRGTDWNDLHVARGIDEVKTQLLAATQRPTLAPVPPAEDDAALTIETALQRFALAMPSAKVWDFDKRQLLNKQAARTFFGGLWFEWSNHGQRRTVNEDDLRGDIAAAKAEGRGGLGDALKRHVLLSGTQDVWDRLRRERVNIGALRLMLSSDYDDWLKHPQRNEMHYSDLIFDPTQKARDGAYINMFRGLPLKPVRNDAACEGIRQLTWRLCNENDEDWDWLMNWLALPLQRVGTKMASAVLMHSNMQGAGKSLFFDGVMRQIYGEYSATVSQHELEDKYTVWRSQKMYSVFEEIFARGQKYDYMGLVKQMITGENFRVEQKFVTGWEENNHMNCVFLSNEIQPMYIEEEDRRFFVVWPRWRLERELQARVVDEIAHGGIEAFYAWLLARDVGEFGAHTQPPRNRAKGRLIDIGRAGWESFALQWRAGDTDAPYGPVRARDLYSFYERWCRRQGERHLSAVKFNGFLKSLDWLRFRKDVHYDVGHKGGKDRFFVPVGLVPPDGKSQSQWYGECVDEWAELLAARENGQEYAASG